MIIMLTQLWITKDNMPDKDAHCSYPQVGVLNFGLAAPKACG
jgi:hypothetical protein